MQLFRLDHAGKVCAGDYLSAEDKQDKIKVEEEGYLLNEGLFLYIIIVSVYTLIGMSCLSACTVAICLSAKKTENEIKNAKSAS